MDSNMTIQYHWCTVMSLHGRSLAIWLTVMACVPALSEGAKLRRETLEAWQEYRRLTEARIDRELESPDGFLVRDFLSDADQSEIQKALAANEIFIERLETKNEEGRDVKIPKGLVHHWYGVILVRGAELDDVLRWEQDYERHASYFEEVEDSRLLTNEGDEYEIFLRLRRKKVITVHYNTEHRVTYRRHGPNNASSRSESTRIAEIEDPGTEREREKPPGNDRGLLWRLNSYWRFHETPEGVVVECESISLSRTIPIAFRWVVKPFINSVPRESLESTLRPLRDAFP